VDHSLEKRRSVGRDQGSSDPSTRLVGPAMRRSKLRVARVTGRFHKQGVEGQGQNRPVGTTQAGRRGGELLAVF